MKKYICTALALLLAASLFTGCGCTNRNVSNRPDGMITAPTNAPATNPVPTMTTPPTQTTSPTTEATMPMTTEPAMTDATVDTEPGTGGTDDTSITEPARSRSRSMNRYN